MRTETCSRVHPRTRRYCDLDANHGGQCWSMGTAGRVALWWWGDLPPSLERGQLERWLAG